MNLDPIYDAEATVEAAAREGRLANFGLVVRNPGKGLTSTMEVNSCLKMIPIPRSIGHLNDGLNLGIDPLTYSIGYSMLRVRQHILKVTMERSSCLDDRLQSRMGCPEVPPLEAYADC